MADGDSTPTQKPCRGPCGRMLPLTGFGKHKMMADGHLNICKECRKAYEAEWRLQNPERSDAIKRRALQKYLATPHGKKNRVRMQRRREILQHDRMPIWANLFFIEEIYELCAQRNAMRALGVRWDVDHIVPLSSPLVCGLHVEANLRVIPQIENRQKCNRFWPDMWPPWTRHSAVAARVCDIESVTAPAA